MELFAKFSKPLPFFFNKRYHNIFLFGHYSIMIDY